MNKTIQHTLNEEQIKSVIDKAVREYSKKYPQYQQRFEWLGQNAELTLVVFGKTIKANITLHTSSVEVQLEVPPSFKMFEAEAMKTFDAEVKKCLKKAGSTSI